MQAAVRQIGANLTPGQILHVRALLANSSLLVRNARMGGLSRGAEKREGRMPRARDILTKERNDSGENKERL